MQDDEFFDLLYQQWSKTTHAADSYWMPEKDEEHTASHTIWAVDRNQNRLLVADNLAEVDADFICGLHGCLGDLIRRLHDAVAKAESEEKRADEAIQDQFQLAVELAELKTKYEPRAEDWHGQAQGGA